MRSSWVTLRRRTGGGTVSTLEVETASGRRTIAVDSLLDAEAAECADVSANQWIKDLRHARVDGTALRDRFTHRGDSLWWFTEIYLHRMRVITGAYRAVTALERLAQQDPGARWFVDGSDAVVGHVARQVAARHGIACEGHAQARWQRRTVTRAKALFHTATAMADRLRPTLAREPRPSRIVAFVHSAFVGAHAEEEAYVGPVIRALGARVPGGIALVGLGPRTNFRVRRWHDRLREFVNPQPRTLQPRQLPSFRGGVRSSPLARCGGRAQRPSLRSPAAPTFGPRR